MEPVLSAAAGGNISAAPSFSADDLLTEQQLSAHSGLAACTLRSWRCRRVGPPFIKVGRYPRYRWADYLSWLVSRRQETRA